VNLQADTSHNTRTRQALNLPSQAVLKSSSQSAIRVSHETHGESLLVFNPREEAILDSMKFGRSSKEGVAVKGSTEANLMREALEHMAH